MQLSGQQPGDPGETLPHPEMTTLWRSSFQSGCPSPDLGTHPDPGPQSSEALRSSQPPALCQLRTQARTPLPSKLRGSRLGWNLSLGEEGKRTGPHKPGPLWCKHPSTRAIRAQGAFCLSSAPGPDPQDDPQDGDSRLGGELG